MSKILKRIICLVALAHFLNFFLGCHIGRQGETIVPSIGHSPEFEATGAIALSGGGIQMCALLNNNQVKCWGEKIDGNSTLSTATNASHKRYDVNRSQFSQISVSVSHTCGILKNIDLPVCFGSEGSWLNVPEQKIKYIASGQKYTCFIREDNTVGCVGDNIDIIKAEALPKHGIEIGTGVENVDYTKKAFKSIKAGETRLCGLGVDDYVYCMGNNFFNAGKSIQQKALDYAITQMETIILTEDNKVHYFGPPTAEEKIKAKKVFHSMLGITGFLTSTGNNDDSGTPIAENTLSLSFPKEISITEVLDFASNKGGISREHAFAYCALKTNDKVSCEAFGVDKKYIASLTVKDIPKEILE
jgi:hypothetical protein